eukprot:scaffold32031_cov63-Cyclotella_meneghiniana.AAC.1
MASRPPSRSQHSLRDSTQTNRRASESLLREAAERRAMKDVSEPVGVPAHDASPATRREKTAAISPIDGSSVLKACLMAPRRSSLPPSKSQSSYKPDITKAPSAFFSRVGKIVRNTYQDVKSTRSAERERMVRSALEESLDRVDMDSLVDQKRRLDHSYDRNEKKCEEEQIQEKRHAKINIIQNENGLAGSVSIKKRKWANDASYRSKKANSLLYDEEANVSASSKQTTTTSKQKLVFPRIPTSSASEEMLSLSQPCNLSNKRQHSVTIKAHNPNALSVSSTHEPLLLEGVHLPWPTSTSVIHLKSFFSAKDERNLAHVPYFGEENEESFDWDLFDIEERMKLYEYGPPYCEQETIETIDQVLKLLEEREPRWFKSCKFEMISEGDEKSKMCSSVQTIEQVHVVLAELSNISVERVQERHAICFGHSNNETKPESKKKQHQNESPNSPLRTQNKKRTEHPTCYQEAVDSYRDLFCRICFTYDCQIHGNLPKPNMKLLGELAISKDHEGHWKEARHIFELFR